MIEAVNLSKRYATGELALDALNLRVEPGEIFYLLGAKGAGKTTVVDLFLGFLQPTSGKALVRDVEVASDPLAARRHLAYLDHNASYYPRLSARQNLQFFAGLGSGAKDRPISREDCYHAMRSVGLPERIFELRVEGLSRGMRQKLGLASAVLKRAPALLLDNPLRGLDPKTAGEVAEALETMRELGTATLLTGTDLFWARRLADRVGILREGRLVLLRSRNELRPDTLDALYLDDPGAS